MSLSNARQLHKQEYPQCPVNVIIMLHLQLRYSLLHKNLDAAAKEG